LPIIPKEQLSNTLVVVSSYSGETEEALDVLRTALQKNIPCAAITSGGTLLAQAREASIPTIIFPKDGVEPRMTLGYAMRAITKLLKEEELFEYVKKSGAELSTNTREKEGASLVDMFTHKIPVFYTSTSNVAIGYILKITFNETAKVPAFANTIPEACHNELSGYDAVASSKEIIHTLLPVFVNDEEDHPRVRARMNLMREIFAKRNIPAIEFTITPHISSLAGAIEVIQTGTSVAVELAKRDGVPDAHTPIIDDFKHLLAKIPW